LTYAAFRDCVIRYYRRLVGPDGSLVTVDDAAAAEIVGDFVSPPAECAFDA
jgi:hypothetical protein